MGSGIVIGSALWNKVFWITEYGIKPIKFHGDDLNTDCEIIWTQCQFQNKGSKSLFLASFYRPSMNDMHTVVYKN